MNAPEATPIPASGIGDINPNPLQHLLVLHQTQLIATMAKEGVELRLNFTLVWEQLEMFETMNFLRIPVDAHASNQLRLLLQFLLPVLHGI